VQRFGQPQPHQPLRCLRRRPSALRSQPLSRVRRPDSLCASRAGAAPE
jgi:hypothetical protein